MAASPDLKFQGKMVGDIKYRLEVPVPGDQTRPGFCVTIELNTKQLPEKSELLDLCDGNIVRVSLRNTEGTARLSFETIIKACDFSVRTENEEEIPIAKIPIIASRRLIEDSGGITALLDIRECEFVFVGISRVQVELKLAKDDKAAKPTTDGKKPTAKPSLTRRPKGFDKPLAN
jgi:hypothetical protein